MKIRGVFYWILLIPLTFLSACAATVAEPSAGSGPVLRNSLRQARVRSIRMELGHAQDRIRALEAELAEQPEVARENARKVAALQARERQLTEELGRTVAKTEALQTELTEARAAAEAATAAAAVAPGPDPEIARLEVELEGERSRRVEAEEQLARLREETSAGPYEAAPTAELEEARAEIDQLTNQLANERKDRQDLERKFADLKLQVEQQAAIPVPVAAAPNPQMAELQEDQRRLMAAIKQDLEASQRREAELRETISSLEGEGGAQLTDKVRNLESENMALQSSLDAEHERNVELAAKLEVATRVADLIFKMRREGSVPTAEAIEEVAEQP